MIRNLTCFIILILTASLSLIQGCKSKDYDEPIISLDDYKIEDGFNLDVIASEPFIEAPVAMDFDNQGRIWVVEMKGYMQSLEDEGAEMPNGTISILEDLDKDGVTDHAKIFIDSLILPRAIAHVYGGLLYAEPPNLWFVNIENDKPINKILVDSLYADGGNVEHQPNGLMMHIDNWIYSAKSNFRYQLKNGKWVKEPTSFRGQWGISKDNFGRLYYNNNSTQLIGDYVLPNTVIKNPYFKPSTTLNKSLTPNQRVFPLHATSVNRGYQEGVLDKDSILVNVTSACGPLIYRGNLFPPPYYENAFVCAPEANLVKRNILTPEGIKVTAEQAIPNKEFIASTDEGFRPVNLFNGPDGNMYIVDMHRGIIQDKAFLTPYLHKHYAAKKLDTIIGMGRLLKVSYKENKTTSSINFERLKIKELTELLYHHNGFLRDRAQHLLVYKNNKRAIPMLEKVAVDTTNVNAQIHALHTLNGLEALNFNFLNKLLSSSERSDIICHGLVLLEQFASLEHVNTYEKLIDKLLKLEDEKIDFYISCSLGKWIKLSQERFFPKLIEIANKHIDNKTYSEGIINSIRGFESEFQILIDQNYNNLSQTVLYELLNKTIENKTKNSKNHIYTQTSVGTDDRTAGYKLFRNICAACHGIEGNGIEGLAPPLMNSEYVKGSKEKLALIILHGLSGPIHVNGKLYDMNLTMPGLAHNPDFTDSDLQNLISYLNNAFTTEFKNISLEKIEELRLQIPTNGATYTEEELLNLNQ